MRVQIHDKYTRVTAAMLQNAGGKLYGPEYQHSTVPFEDREAALERFQQQMPRFAAPVSKVDKVLPPRFGTSAIPGFNTFTLPGSGGSPQQYHTNRRPIMPEFDSQDRASFPVHRCLSEGTLVQYFSGVVGPIELVTTGDLLLGPGGQPREVLEAWSDGTPSSLVRITWTDGDAVTCTPEHVWPTTRGDVLASELKTDDSCFRWVLDATIQVKVRNVEQVDNSQGKLVFDLTVSGDHKYCLAGGLVTHNSLGNVIWRLFYKLDPVIGTGIDMKSDMCYGPFTVSGEGVDGEIKDAMMACIERTQVAAKLPYFDREEDITGEAIPHLIWDDDSSMWSYLALHNPDHIEVIYSPLFPMDPILRYRPDDRLQQVLTAPYPRAQALRSSMPGELLHAIQSGQPIELDPLFVSFLPRKNHLYDVRGTSVISRLWRCLALEDSLWDATISTARRASAPLKIAKLGNTNSAYIVSPLQEQRFIEAVTAAEADPQGWVVWNDSLTIDYAGNQDRLMNISQYWDMFERIKLIALGINRGFLVGETSYAAAASGVTIFLQRAKARRDQRVSQWLLPKFFKPLSVMNGWIKPTPAEIGDRGKPNVSPTLRTKRAPWQAQDRYVKPNIEWDIALDPEVGSAQLQAIQALSDLGVKFSKQYMASLVGRDYEEELKQSITEAENEQKMIANNPKLLQFMTPANSEGGPSISPGLGGGGMSGGEGDMGDSGAGMGPGALPTDLMSQAPEGQPAEAPAPTLAPGGAAAPGHGVIPGGGVQKDWQFGQLLGMFKSNEPDVSPWYDALQQRAVRRAFDRQDPVELWETLEDFLLDQGAPATSIASIKHALIVQGVFGNKEASLLRLLGPLPNDKDKKAWNTAPL